MENKCLNANNISQYYGFYCISGEHIHLSITLWNVINPKLLKIYTVMQKSHTFMVLSASLLRLQSQFIVIELLGKLIMVIAGIIWTRFSWTTVAKSFKKYLFYHQHSFLKVHSNYYTNNKPTHPHINQTQHKSHRETCMLVHKLIHHTPTCMNIIQSQFSCITHTQTMA